MNFWSIIYRFSLITFAVLVVIGILCMFYPQYRQYQEYQRREAELEEQIRLEEDMLRSLREKQDRFRSDPRYVERIAHEMGLARPEETIFKFSEDEPTNP